MKILSLNFKNINSLQGEHTVDFTSKHFTQNPLFAITGPTGSGKTTILDVITLALFGKVPRLGKIYKSDVEEKGAILTKNQKDCFARVTYECEEGIYDSVWYIGLNRNGNLNDYEMELSRVDLPESLDLSKTQVPGKNENLIGLSYEQFVKSVLLAQGEFAEFLKAKRKERSELLEKITGTGIYRKLGQLAFEKFSIKNKIIENENHILESEKEKLLAKEEKNKIHFQLEEILEIKNKVEQKFETFKKQIDLKTDLEKVFQLLKKKSKTLKSIEKQQEVFIKENGNLLKNHENVQRFSEELYKWKTKQKELESLKAEKKKFLDQQKDIEENKNQLFKEIKTFIGKEILEEKLILELSKFKEKVDLLEKEKKKLEDDFKEKRINFNAELKDFELKYSVKNLIQNPRSWKEILENHQVKEGKLKQIFKNNFPENVEKELEINQQEIEILTKAENDQQYILRIAEEVKQKEEDLKGIKNQIKPLPEKIKELKTQGKLAKTELKNLRAEQKINLLQGELENYRKELKSGEACFLCGSTSHPYAENLPGQKDELEIKIEHKEKKVNELASQFSRNQTLFEELKKQENKIEEELEKENKELEKLKTTFEEKYVGKFEITEKNWQKKQENLKTKNRNLKEYEVFEKLNLSLLKAKPLYDEMQNIIKKGLTKKEEIQALYKGKNIAKEVRDLENKWQNITSEYKNIQQRIVEIVDKEKEENQLFDKIEKDLLPKLNKIGFSEILSAQKALLPIDKYENLKQKVLDFQEKIKVFKTEIKTYKERKIELSNEITTSKTKEELILKKEDLAKKKNNIQLQEEEFKRLLKNDEELIAVIAKREGKIAKNKQQISRWKLLNRLIGDKTGNKFNQFAQDLTLRQLLVLANKRLGEINKRYRLVFNFNSDKNQDNLVIADMDMGGQERAVQTLSGGESFLVSLALALGLSDLASKKININSLFIDEGFGTLDASTLDQTLDVLESLQASTSKIIGIISHVDSLKERIGTQIELQKNGQGYSSLEIISV